MGRAGRGGGSGGGHFGGSRGFGTHSGGSSHRSSFGSSHSYHSSSHHSYHSSHHYNSGFGSGFVLGSIVSGSNPRRRSTSSSNGVGIAIFIIIFVAYLLLESFSNSTGGSIQKSTIQREKLKSTALVESDVYYEDHLDWIKSKLILEAGMKYFYKKTGVQPYLVITDNIGGNGTYSDTQMEKFASDVYDQNFNDEAHLVVVFYEKNQRYHSCYYTGAEAKTVIDDEAGEILLDYLDHYYYSDYDEDEFFAKSFEDSADRMMKVTPRYGWITLIIILIIIAFIIAFTWWNKHKKQKIAEMNKAQQILDSDLDQFGTADMNSGTQQSTIVHDSSEVDELKRKYDNM